jgi:hypothetical protein
MRRPVVRLRALTPPAVKPIGGLFDSRFVYVPAAATDIRKTFDRIRAEQQLQQQKGQK